MKKKFNKTTSCIFMLLKFLDTNKFDKENLINTLDITEQDYFRYRVTILNAFYDLGYYDLIEKYYNANKRNC